MPVLWDIMTFMWCHSLQWCHNEHDGISNHQPHDCLLNCLFRCRSKKTSKLRVTGLCVGNSPVTCEMPAQRASNTENVSIWWHHHVLSFTDIQVWNEMICKELMNKTPYSMQLIFQFIDFKTKWPLNSGGVMLMNMQITSYYLELVSLTWFDFNLGIDKWLHIHQNVWDAVIHPFPIFNHAAI